MRYRGDIREYRSDIERYCALYILKNIAAISRDIHEYRLLTQRSHFLYAPPSYVYINVKNHIFCHQWPTLLSDYFALAIISTCKVLSPHWPNFGENCAVGMGRILAKSYLACQKKIRQNSPSLGEQETSFTKRAAKTGENQSPLKLLPICVKMRQNSPSGDRDRIYSILRDLLFLVSVKKLDFRLR